MIKTIIKNISLKKNNRNQSVVFGEFTLLFYESEEILCNSLYTRTYEFYVGLFHSDNCFADDKRYTYSYIHFFFLEHPIEGNIVLNQVNFLLYPKNKIFFILIRLLINRICVRTHFREIKKKKNTKIPARTRVGQAR